MPKYRIISEIDLGAEHREPRGAALRLDEARPVTVVDADSLAEAASGARDTDPHQKQRIVSVKEVHPGFSYDDETINRLLGTAEASPTGEQLADPMGSTGETDDPILVADVVYGLRESGLVPGLNISVLANETDEPYAMVEVFDEARGIYLSRGVEVRRIAEERSATGWNAVLSVARGLIALSNDLH